MDVARVVAAAIPRTRTIHAVVRRAAVKVQHSSRVHEGVYILIDEVLESITTQIQRDKKFSISITM